MKEFAEILGWSIARLSAKLKRQQEGAKSNPPLPEPVQILAATPVWKMEQAKYFKKLIDKENKRGKRGTGNGQSNMRSKRL